MMESKHERKKTIVIIASNVRTCKLNNITYNQLEICQHAAYVTDIMQQSFMLAIHKQLLDKLWSRLFCTIIQANT